VRKNAYSGIAAVTALSMIPDPTPGKQFSFGGGFGEFRGYGAGALGINARFAGNLSLKGGIGYSAGNTTAGMGIGISW